MLNYYPQYVMSLYGNSMKKSLIITIIALYSLLPSESHSANNLILVSNVFLVPLHYMERLQDW